MFCIECGGSNPDDARFCNACGKSLPAKTGSAKTIEARRPVQKNWKKGLIAFLILGVVVVLIHSEHASDINKETNERNDANEPAISHTDSIEGAKRPRLVEKIYLEPVDRTLEPLGSDDSLSFDENIKLAVLTNGCNECFGDRMKALQDIAWNKAGFRYGNNSGERVAWTPCGAGREDHLCCFFRLRMQLWNNSAANILWLGDVTADTLDPITEHAKLISDLYDWKINPHKYRETSLLLKNSDTQVAIRSNTNGMNPKVLREITNKRIQSAFGQLTALENPQVNAILSSDAGASIADLTDDQLVKILRNLAETKNFKVDAILRSEGIGVWDTRTGIKLVGGDD